MDGTVFKGRECKGARAVQKGDRRTRVSKGFRGAEDGAECAVREALAAREAQRV